MFVKEGVRDLRKSLLKSVLNRFLSQLIFVNETLKRIGLNFRDDVLEIACVKSFY